ncbi:ubiquitin-conjugating enzyme E2 J2-like isoform X2 [Vespa mandarinia]|uniref:ubiquitin-conjugating enzyme E2 J2-like isoform X2 n=1 Tax=Vespa mandarinia TaxID=7446 RepID=UPI00161EF3A2|nr:ubiquitin-conjugating enzyme E2 J2-like isoform X2 [Vespa mandarinia]XP_046828233.1 ubiquitin-conjugating enzyme E2 J2 isoform X2 [Vespa crabro]XP_047367791.1 ubiquitin-conjugating enzyme E2 J2 isoform X2 [Vespa velutina]
MVRMNKKPNSATARLKQDYLRLKKDPVPYVLAEPVPSNILEWHYVVKGPEKTPYEGGFYHGKLIFPGEFPFQPPSIYMTTPNGRFKIEKSPTFGSINTTDYEKRELAMQSLEYNLRDKMFCELFPETVEIIKVELERRKELEKQARHQSTASEVSSLIRDQLHREQSPLHGAITNLVVLIGFAAFAFIVKYVLRSIATEYSKSE